MSNVILSYCYHDVKDNSSAELEKKYCRGVSSNVTNSKLTGIFLIILTMCVCIRSVESSAEIRDNSLWQEHQHFTKHVETTNHQPQPNPSFGKVPSSIEVMPGQTAVLSCIVNDLGEKTVSWIRLSDLQILTSGSITFTGDNRFSTEPTDDILSNCWGLMIRNVRYTDYGVYECQISTTPKLKINVTLIVREPALMDRPFLGTVIDGPRQQEIKSGSTMTLTCRALVSQMNENEQNKIGFSKSGTQRTKRVIWSVNDTPITLQIKRGGINVYTDWNFSEVVSNLTLSNVTEGDQGVYKCSIDDIGSDEVSVHVFDDNKKTTGFIVASASHSISLFYICYTFAFVIVSHLRSLSL